MHVYTQLKITLIKTFIKIYIFLFDSTTVIYNIFCLHFIIRIIIKKIIKTLKEVLVGISSSNMRLQIENYSIINLKSSSKYFTSKWFD